MHYLYVVQFNFFECLQYALLASSIHAPLTSDAWDNSPIDGASDLILVVEAMH